VIGQTMIQLYNLALLIIISRATYLMAPKNSASKLPTHQMEQFI